MKERKHTVRCWYCYQPGTRRCTVCKKSICGSGDDPCCNKRCKPYQRETTRERFCWYCSKDLALKFCKVCRHYVCDNAACDTCGKDHDGSCYVRTKRADD